MTDRVYFPGRAAHWARCAVAALCTTLTLIALPSAARADDTPTPTPPTRPATRPGGGFGQAGAEAIIKRVRARLEELDLTQEQKTKIDALVEKASEDLKAIRAEATSGEPREQMAKAMERLKTLRTEVAEVLTPEQKEKFEKIASRAGAEAGAGTGLILQRVQEALDKLDLTPEQKPKVDAVMEEMKAKFAEIRTQAQSGGVTEEAREKGRTMFAEERQKLMDILTPEQQAKLHEMMQAGGAAKPKAEETK